MGMPLAGEDIIFPFEFHLAGTPISMQARGASKDRWKAEVKEAARQRIEEAVDWLYLQDQQLSLTIYYFPIARMNGDIDNIVKLIMDALVGISYLDDQSVERIVVQKFEPGENWEFSTPSEQLSAALNKSRGSPEQAPVVYVCVQNDLSWRRL